MTKKIVLIFFTTVLMISTVYADKSKLTPSVSLLAENAYTDERLKLWVYFDSTAIDYSQVVLSDKSLKRRKRVDPENFLIDENDYNLKVSVLDEIKQHADIRHVIRWFKAVSIETNKAGLEKISAISAVNKIDKVYSFTRTAPDEFKRIEKESIQDKSSAFDYGQSQFQNQFINAVKLHQAGYTGKGVTIAMFDTGFRTDFPVFDSIDIVGTYDFINHDIAVDEIECENEISRNHQTFHGTATLAVIGSNLSGEMVGAAPDATFLLAKTEITCGNTEINIEEDNWIAAALWADSAGADIISSSLGYIDFSDGELRRYTPDDLDGNTALITIAADIAASKNILVVNSAGNERGNYWGTIITPSDGDSVIAVGAVSADSTLAGFSSPGPSADGRIKPDITSFGVGVFTQSHLGGYLSINGTSFSAPLVSAGAALALEHDPSMTAEELRQLIRNSGDRRDNPDNDYGYGIFDAVKTADIIKFNPPHNFITDIDNPQPIDLIATGRSNNLPTLSALNLPGWIIFTDNNNGTGSLEFDLIPLNPETVFFQLIADVGYFADTSDFSLTLRSEFDDIVRVGPNPFSDSVNMYVDIFDQTLKSLTIYNLAGEIVWEKVNNFTLFADVIIEQWDGLNSQGEKTASGVYILVVRTDSRTFQVKLLKVDT